MTRAGQVFAATVLALAGGSCGKFGLFHGPDGAPDERDAGGAASADATTDRATGGDAPGDVPPAGPPFATIVRVTNAPPCTGRCSLSAPIPAGSYAFTLQHSTGDHTVEATLPAPGGIVEIPVQ
jgi:hypothetical protein